jgi:photosystem II stability/assembly factor-like uncharacterized protein
MKLAPLLLLCLSVSGCATAQQPAPPIDASLLAGLRARSIGPAGTSGRIGAVCGVPGDPTTLWVGAARGGVWKSTDGGMRFQPMFDDQDCTSIGAIAIDRHSPDVVWVGTGEGGPRNSASVGRGVYRTRDGGRTWQKLGLEHSERIQRVVLHPDNMDVAFAAALGTTWGENEERGVFRTRDGGKTWEKVLYVDARTGCADLVMDPRNPDKLFAAMWEHRRWPWSFKSGGPGSGLYRSLDGGSTWQKLAEKDGMPAGELGRIGLAISDSDPRVVYALTEAQKSALLRSDDGGFHFHVQNQNDNVAMRPFYFCGIRVDPQDKNRIYSLHMVLDASNDGGKTFQTIAGGSEAHPDHHAIWIDPLDPLRVVIGNDGGVYQSSDRGASWRFCANLPLAQFYHVAVDNDVPYNIYGGLQDNGSFRGPSTVWENGGIRNFHWQEVCFGDGFAVLPDPSDSRQGYAMSQGGFLIRYDLRTGQQKFIRPPSPELDLKLRFNWNAAIAQDPRAPGTIYYGSQFLHRSTSRGENWEVISPDLTTNNPDWQKQDESGGLSADVTGAENHCTIMAIAPSPVQAGVIWVGTDDGRVQVTQDDGKTWTSVEANVPGLPKNTWCPHLEAGRFEPGTAFAVFDGHRNADWTPYVYRTDDFGRTWRSLASKAVDGYCLTVVQDPVAAELLFLGTEFGLYFSRDAGASWQRWKHGVPACSAMALTVHPRTNDLVLATHGRSIYIVDDIRALRAMTPEISKQKLHLFAPRDAIAWTTGQSPGTRFAGSGEFRGETQRRGAWLDVWTTAEELQHPDAEQEKARQKAKAEAKKAEPKPPEAKPGETKPEGEKKPDDKPKEPPKDQVTVEVRDGAGTLIRTFREGVKLGLNRVVWNLERDGVQGPARELQEVPELPPGGREVLPGEYEVTVKFQGEEQKGKLHVFTDPRVEIATADRQAKDQAQARAEAIRADLFPVTQRLARARRDFDLVKKRLELEPKPKAGETDPKKAIRDAADKVEKALTAAEEQLWGPTKPKQGFTEGKGLMRDMFMHLGAMTGTPEVPNATELLGLDRAKTKAAEVAAAVDTFTNGPLAEFRTAVQQSGMELVPQDGKAK